MPQPSPEARAKDNAKKALGESYFKNGRTIFSIHVGNECSSCWVEITEDNTAGNGYCENCYQAKDLEAQRKFWSKDMNKFYNKHGYLERGAFNMSTRILNPSSKKRYAII